MISAQPMMKYCGMSQKTDMGTGAVLFCRPSAATSRRRTTSTMQATTMEKALICARGQKHHSVSQQDTPACGCHPTLGKQHPAGQQLLRAPSLAARC